MKLFLCIGLSLLSAFSLLADRYEISNPVIGKAVPYNNRNLQGGDIIFDTTPLELNEDNVITVFNLNKSNRSYVIAGDKYKRNKCKNFGEYFSKPVMAVTRNDQAIQLLHQLMDSTFYWKDNVCVPTLFDKEPTRVFAIEIMDALNKYHEVILPSLDSGRVFSFPKELIFPDGDIHPLIFNFKIGLKDPESEITMFDTVIQNIILIPIHENTF